jgi:hypothetical protein
MGPWYYVFSHDNRKSLSYAYSTMHLINVRLTDQAFSAFVNRPEEFRELTLNAVINLAMQRMLAPEAEAPPVQDHDAYDAFIARANAHKEVTKEKAAS